LLAFSALAVILVLLVGYLCGARFAYNPMSSSQLILTIALSLLLFAAGLILYSKLCWRQD